MRACRSRSGYQVELVLSDDKPFSRHLQVGNFALFYDCVDPWSLAISHTMVEYLAPAAATFALLP